MTESPYHPDLRRIAPLLPRASVTRRNLRVWKRLTGPSGWKVLPSRRRSSRAVQTFQVGAVSVRLHGARTSRSSPAPGVLWIHAGGYVMGSAWQDDPLCSLIAEELDTVVAAVDYRLAPEHRFPTALEDCHEALRWLAARPDVDAERLAVAGASAGGGLAASLALLVRERGGIEPVLQLLSYPMLDDRTALRSDLDERHVRMWNNEANRLGWESYLGPARGGQELSPLAAAARAADLAGLPPAWIGVGTLDVLCEEGCAYASRLREAGVDCHLELVEGAIHAFDSVATKAPVTARFRSAQLASLASAFERS